VRGDWSGAVWIGSVWAATGAGRVGHKGRRVSAGVWKTRRAHDGVVAFGRAGVAINAALARGVLENRFGRPTTGAISSSETSRIGG
jgi:hypothetical protein